MYFITFYDKFIKEHIVYDAENKSKLDKLIDELVHDEDVLNIRVYQGLEITEET